MSIVTIEQLRKALGPEPDCDCGRPEEGAHNEGCVWVGWIVEDLAEGKRITTFAQALVSSAILWKISVKVRPKGLNNSKVLGV